MMIMLRIPENQHKLSSAERLPHGCAALTLRSYTAPTNTRFWPGEEAVSQPLPQQRQKQNPRESGRQYAGRKRAVWLSCVFFPLNTDMQSVR